MLKRLGMKCKIVRSAYILLYVDSLAKTGQLSTCSLVMAASMLRRHPNNSQSINVGVNDPKAAKVPVFTRL